MSIKYLTPFLLSGLLLSACDKMSASNCSSEVAHKIIAKNLIETVEKKTASDKYSDSGEFIFDKAKTRASLDQLQISVDSVRTTKEDPDSSKKFCSATLKVTIPTSMLSDADQGRELEHKTKISEAARELNIDNSINVFTQKDFEYSVQPTDDGKELYVESENGIWVRLLHDITWSALLKPKLEEQKAAQDQQNMERKQEVEQLKQEAEVSKLEAEKLQALQEKQEADSLKQELLAKQATTSTDYYDTSDKIESQELLAKQTTTPTTSPEQTLTNNQTWTGDWGNGIIATVSSQPCKNIELINQDYNYLMTVSIPIARLKNPADAWRVSGDRAITIAGCWSKRDGNMIHAKLTRKKGSKTWEQDFKLDDGNWIAK